MKAYHNIQPVYNQDSTILVLGSFPSVKSREGEFFYHHPQNRFWKVLAEVFEDDLPQTIEQKKQFLLKHHIALWDVIASCDIKGSSDSSISHVEVNDLSQIINQSHISHIYTNGNLSDQYYHRYFDFDIPVTKLPSTSPANATYSLQRLVEHWKVMKQ